MTTVQHICTEQIFIWSVGESFEKKTHKVFKLVILVEAARKVHTQQEKFSKSNNVYVVNFGVGR